METQTTHRRAKLQLRSVVGLFRGQNLDCLILEQQLKCRDKVHFHIFQSFSIGGPPNVSAAVRFIVTHKAAVVHLTADQMAINQ